MIFLRVSEVVGLVIPSPTRGEEEPLAISIGGYFLEKISESN